jgi:hypothetical protein
MKIRMQDNMTLKEMEKNFDELYQKSDYKETLLMDEIRGYKLLFDKDELPFPVPSTKDQPLREYDIPYSSTEIFLIREFHRRYNVRNYEFSKMYKEDLAWTMNMYNSAWGGYLEPSKLAEPHGPKYYIMLAEKLSMYLKWLEEYRVQKVKKDIVQDTAVWALYYHIFHKVDASKSFDLDPDGKINAIKKTAEEKGISPKNFQMQYNYLNKSRPSEFLTNRKFSIIQKVVELFEDNPDCLKLAKEYLNKAKLKR